MRFFFFLPSAAFLGAFEDFFDGVLAILLYDESLSWLAALLTTD